MSVSIYVPTSKGKAFEWAFSSLEDAKAKIATFYAKTQAKVLYKFEGEIVQKYNCMVAEIAKDAVSIHVCPVCGKEAKNAGGLASHMRVHKPAVERTPMSATIQSILDSRSELGTCEICHLETDVFEVEGVKGCMICLAKLAE